MRPAQPDADRGGVAEQRDLAAGLGSQGQRRRRVVGEIVGRARATVAGLDEIECRCSRCLGVECEGEVDGYRGVAGGVSGDQEDAVGAVRQRAAGQRVEQIRRQHEAAVGLQGAAQVDEAWRAGGIECRQQAGHAGSVAGLAAEGRVAREAVARRNAAVVRQRGDGRRCAAVGRRARQLAKARRAAQDAVDARTLAGKAGALIWVSPVSRPPTSSSCTRFVLVPSCRSSPSR